MVNKGGDIKKYQFLIKKLVFRKTNYKHTPLVSILNIFKVAYLLLLILHSILCWYGHDVLQFLG